MSRVAAESILQEILKPINEGIERAISKETTFESFVELTCLPVYQRKWKGSTNDTETNRIRVHLVGEIAEARMRAITPRAVAVVARREGHAMRPQHG
ncbi:MAG: hypothetical protein WA324_27340 [Bryobacteraceae bacterium]